MSMTLCLGRATVTIGLFYRGGLWLAIEAGDAWFLEADVQSGFSLIMGGRRYV